MQPLLEKKMVSSLLVKGGKSGAPFPWFHSMESIPGECFARAISSRHFCLLYHVVEIVSQWRWKDMIDRLSRTVHGFWYNSIVHPNFVMSYSPIHETCEALIYAFRANRLWKFL